MVYKALYIRLLSVILFMSASMTWAQDVRFNNVNSDLISVSPSLLDFNTYSNKVGANYRQAINLSAARGGSNNSIISVNKLYSVFYQGGLSINKADKLNYQLRIAQDNPTNGVVKRTDIKGTLSFAKTLSANGANFHRLSIGSSFGFNNIRPTNNSFWFGSQYDVEDQRVNLGLPSGEISLDRLVSRSAFDLALGLNWFSRLESFGSISLGGAMFHMVPYNQSLYDNGDLTISRRYTGFVNVDVFLSRATHLISTVITESQNPFLTVSWRNMVMFDASSKIEMSYGFGLAPRWVDNYDTYGLESIGVYTMINLPSWQLELSYDIGIGDVTRFTDSRGHIELGVNYFFNRISERYLPQSYL